MTKESRPLTQEQRKEFVQLLKDAKDRILSALSNRHWKRSEKARAAAMAALMESLGATKLHEKVTTASKELKDSEKSLKTLGFRVDDSGDIVFTSEGEERYESQFNGELSVSPHDAAQAELVTSVEPLQGRRLDDGQQDTA